MTILPQHRDVIDTMIVNKVVDMLTTTGVCDYRNALVACNISHNWYSKVAWSDIKRMAEHDLGLTDRNETVAVSRDYFRWLAGTRTFSGVKRDPRVDPAWFMVNGGRGKKPDGLVMVTHATSEMLEHLGRIKGNRVKGHVNGAKRLEDTMEKQNLTLDNGSTAAIVGIVAEAYKPGEKKIAEEMKKLLDD